MNRLRADLLLFLTAFIWGTAFIAQKDANQSMGPITFVGLRFLLSALALIPLALYERRRAKTASAPPFTRRDWLQALIVGLCLFSGGALQQVGLVTTTATNGGFLTALYVVIVPFMVWGMSGAKPRLLVMAACAVSIAGAWLLTDDGSSRHWEMGDLLLVLADFAWALAITVIADFMQRTHRPFFLSLAQYCITAVLGLGIGLIFENQSLTGIDTAMPSILYAGLLSGGVAYTLGIVAQRYTPPAEASLIMCLESVFAALAGAVMLHERLTLTASIGCALILLGVVLVEVGPALMRYAGRTAAN
jgi:drug/metabolite transporter (DMT)-like permease